MTALRLTELCQHPVSNEQRLRIFAWVIVHAAWQERSFVCCGCWNRMQGFIQHPPVGLCILSLKKFCSILGDESLFKFLRGKWGRIFFWLRNYLLFKPTRYRCCPAAVVQKYVAPACLSIVLWGWNLHFVCWYVYTNMCLMLMCAVIRSFIFASVQLWILSVRKLFYTLNLVSYPWPKNLDKS